MNPKSSLAEEAGILAGNGYLFDDTENYHTGFDVYGNLYDDFPYLEFYVKPLIERLNNVRVRTYVHPLSSTVILRVNSADALRTKVDLGLPIGRKTHLKIPGGFLQERELFLKFVRGLFDIEGTLRFHKDNHSRHTYPVLECEMADPTFIGELHDGLTLLDLKPSIRKRTEEKARAHEKLKARLFFSGWSNLHLWFRSAGLKNAKHLSKLLLYESYGFCPPWSSLDERLSMITGRINPTNLAKTREERRDEAYRVSHELLILRLCQEPKLLNTLKARMKSRLALTEYVLRHLEGKRELKIGTNKNEPIAATTGLGSKRIEDVFEGWKIVNRAFKVPVPTSSSYYPDAFD